MSVESIQIPPGLAQVLNRAGDKSDVDFDYLVRTAMRESSMNPSAKAQTSSAVGLFQFLESTWLQVMKQEGDRLGYGNYVQAIKRDSEGNLFVPNNALRNEILALREDPQISADLAAAFTRRNGQYLQSKFGRQPSPGELYIAHFLGAAGAERMFNAGLDNPDQIAANLFPRQAQANRAIFYDSGGARTIREVYQALVAKHGQNTLDINSGTPLATNVAAHLPNAAPLPATLDRPPQPRIGPPLPETSPLSFSTLYQPPAAERPATPRTIVVDPGAALFVQLYAK